MKRQSGLPEKNKLQFVKLLAMESRDSNYTRCICKTECKTNRCACKKSNFLCDSIIHRTLNCENR